MITVNEAFSIINNLIFTLVEKELALFDAKNAVLSQTVFSPINMPIFRQSNRDGYALALHNSNEYEIVGEIKAGDGETIHLQPGQAIKIFTGAAVPDSAGAVVQIEDVAVVGQHLKLNDPIVSGANVRPVGAQIKTNSIALEKGTFLNPASIGFLAALGLGSVKIYQKPKVAIVITGNELVQPGEDLTYGKVYESNGVMLQTALHNAQFESTLFSVNDDFENTVKVLKQAINGHDLVVISGGISVGDYDFAGKALESLGAETLFYKVNQKPGKPLMAAKIQEKIVYALPGNPAAALTCFYIYVLPTLQKLSGQTVDLGTTIEKPLAHDYHVNNSREQFLKAQIMNDTVTILPHQDSSMLDSFALANALVYFPNGDFSKNKGELVEVYPILFH